MNYKIFTSESVAAGHPDKICDQLADASLDAALKVDSKARVAVECLVTKGQVVMAGEVSCKKVLNFEKIGRKVVRSLGYTDPKADFSFLSPLSVFIHQQSSDISLGVDKGGAGDQGMMFGYATNETPELMPLPITLAHQLVRLMDKARKTKKIPYLRPDGKSEIKVVYENGKPKAVEQVVLAVPHDRRIKKRKIKKDLYEKIIKKTLGNYGYSCPPGKVIINGTGRWETGGPISDTGCTGRKIIVDTYGGMGRHGGGCFSGKDPTKVDRSAAYACRFIAKNIVAHGMADRCEVQVAYVIGHREPITKAIEAFGTENADLKKIEKFAWSLLDLSVPGIIKKFKLLRPIYLKTASYGHFGRPEFPWEKIVS